MSGLLGISKCTLFGALAEERDVPVDSTDISKCFSGERSSSFCALFSFCLFFDRGVVLPSAISTFTMPRSGPFLLRLLLALFV